MMRPPETLTDDELEATGGANRAQPYTAFNFTVETGTGDAAAAFDGRLLTADDLTREQDGTTGGFSEVSGLGTEVIVAD